ncbi:MAG: hypothetical protein OES14_04970 [Nitrosopumilus sp.]|nr:hypothetical protein [Nitrosopumilus sp.]MDH3825123.1 hypothetical protein [Nitrosopumilus sp.]
MQTINQDTCIHDAKVKMAGYKDRYECTRCHKFLIFDTLSESNKISNYPKYGKTEFDIFEEEKCLVQE